MSYGIKYISTAKGLSSVQWKIELLEKNYSGSTIDVRMVDDGITIGYDRDDDRFNVIYSRYAILNLKVNSQLNLNSLQFDDERKFQVKIYKNNVLEFIGWLIPFYSSQEFEDDKIASISVMAKDGINQLKNKTYVNIKPEVLSKKQSFKDVIIQSLSEVGYSLNTEIYYNKYEDGMNKTSSDCPLSQCFINIESFIDKDGININYYDVLHRLLLQHDLRISQVNGVWCITSPIEVIDGSISGRVYNYLGVKTGNKTLSTDLNIHTSGLKVISNSQIRKSIPVQQFTANFEFGSDKNLVLNGELKDIVDYEPNKWNLGAGWVNGEVQEIVGGGIIFKDTYATRPPQIQLKTPIADASLTSDKYLESDEINVAGLDSFMLEAETYFDGDIDALRIRVEMYNEGGTDKSYIDEFGKLTLVPSSIYSYNQEVDSYRLIKIEWENMTKFGFLVDFKYMKIRIYEGIRLRSGTPVGTTVKYRNIRVTGKPQYFNKTFVGKKYQISNSALTSSKKEDEYKIYYKDSNDIYEPQSVYRIYLNDNPDDNISKTSGRWKRTAESTTRTLIESVLVDKLAVTSKFGDIFEGSIYGYVDINKTPALVDSEQRFIVLWSEYKVATNTTEVLLCENITDAISLNTKRFNVFDDDTIVEVDSVSEVGNLINLGEKYNKPVTIEGGITHGILYPDGGIDSLPKDTTNPRAGNKGILIFGGTNAEEITLGNKENQTLVDVLGGKIKVGYGLLYDKSITDGDGDVVKQLGLDSDFQVDGRIEAVSGISVGSDGILITKELGAGGKPFGQVDAQNELRFVSPIVNVTNVLGVNQITGIGTNPITANAPIYFTQPIYVQASANPNSPITNAQFDTALSSYDFGNIRIYGSVDAASNGSNITLSGLYTLDGVGLQVGVKVLVKDQTDPKQNYIYLADVGAWSRVTDLPNNSIKGVQVQVLGGGTVNKGGIFVNTNTTEVTIGTTNVTFRQSFQNITGFNSASLIANNQIFTGSNKFENKLEVRTPLSNTEAVNVSYVTLQLNNFGSSISNAYWSKISTYGIGTTTNNSLQFYVNNVKKAELLTNGMLTGLKAIHINDGAFNMPFLTSFPNYYGATIKDNLHVGSLGGTSKALYSLDLIRGLATGYRSGVRFGAYNGAGEVNQFYYGIEYSTANKLTIGRYATTAMDGAGTSLDATKSIIINSTGLAGFGIDPTERIDVNGNIKVSGVYKPSGVAPTAGNMFLVSNGTTGNKYMDFGEFGQFQTHAQFGNISALPWGTSFVNGTTTGLPNAGLQAHVVKMSIGSEYPDQATYLAIPRPFANYFDGQIYVRGIYGTADSGWISVGGGNFKDYDFDEYEATIKYHGYFYNNTPEGREGFIGFNRLDGGVILEYKYTEIDSNVTTTYRNIMNSDGRLAYQIGNSEAKRYALFEEIGTGGVGITYTPNEPIFFVGNQINVRTASATQNGVLTKENWTTFNNKQNTLLKASSTQDGYLSKEDFATFLAATGGGTGTTYSFVDPIYLDGTAVKIKVATSIQNGVLTKEDWAIFNGKQNTLAKASSTQDGYLSKEDFATFLAGTGSGGGVTYTLADPLFFNGNQINVKVASATQNGVLTKEDWTKFNTGVLWNGGLVSNNIQLYRPNGDNVELLWGAVYPITSVTSSSYGNLAARITWKSSTPGLYTWNFGNGVNGMVIETAYTGDGMYIGTQGEMKLKANKIYINGIELNMTKVASQIGV